MAKKKVPAAVSEYFRKLGKEHGSAGGKIGGKRSLETMTPEQRTARAKKAAAASAAVRAKKVKRKPAGGGSGYQIFP
jgi:hypothetical protein